MGLFETPIVRKLIVFANGFRHIRLFRNNVGAGWVGEVVKWRDRFGQEHIHHPDGTVRILHGRRIKFGLINGASDTVGAVSVLVTPAMVGKTIGVALCVEAKTEKGVAKRHQEIFLAQAIRMGCIAGIARNPEELNNLIASWLRRFGGIAGVARIPEEAEGIIKEWEKNGAKE
jgi:hypothetical protein